MQKTILITGSTDGIGLETAKMLLAGGERVLLHGRNPKKLEPVRKSLTEQFGAERIETYLADLSRGPDVENLAAEVSARHNAIDVLINNAGVYIAPKPATENGLDIRFVVNAIAPYLLTKKLLPLLGPDSRVVNVSSAAQSPVDLDALFGRRPLTDGAAYAQSKLALTMWSRYLADELGANGPVIVAVNPASLLGSKMVKEAFGVSGKDLHIGADILTRAAVADEFSDANGKYFDNDQGQFSEPHPDALDPRKREEVVRAIEAILAEAT